MLLPCTKLNCTSVLAVPWIILRSNLRILKNIMQRDQQQLHLRGNIILYQGNGSICHLWLKFTERLKFDCACVFSTLDIYALNRPCVLYSDNHTQSTTNVTEDLSKCVIRDDTRRAQLDSSSIGANRVPQGECNLKKICSHIPIT